MMRPHGISKKRKLRLPVLPWYCLAKCDGHRNRRRTVNCGPAYSFGHPNDALSPRPL